MIALDTNLLLYAHRKDSEWNAAAYACIEELAASPAAWAIPWPCVSEFVAVATHPRIFSPPSHLNEAVDQIEAWLEAPGIVLLAETEAYWPRLRAALQAGRISGPRVHDARIAALCQLHGVRELWTADRDFSRFTALRVRNPLSGSPD
ncbi:MAG: PIN domain-containing protein [Proteobacteria bacterium]|nr:PIN domain-containing protein [Pseudomonadota bacterium]